MLKYKECQKHLLVHVIRCTIKKKSCYRNKSCKNYLKFQNFNSTSRLKIQVDSFLTVSTVLENWIKSLRNQEYLCTFFFLTKIVITQIWPSRVSHYSKIINEQLLYWITFLWYHSANISSQLSIIMKKKTIYSRNKIMYKTVIIKVHVRSWMTWHYKVWFNHAAKINC